MAKSPLILNETYFEWWLEELKSMGLVLSFEREPESFVVLDSINVDYLKHYKTKPPVWRGKKIANELIWTPDYKVLFNRKFINKLIGVINYPGMTLMDYNEVYPGSGEYDNVYQETLFYTTDVSDDYVVAWFDVKPPAKVLQFSAKVGSSRDFRYLRTLLFNKEQIYVNKVVPIQLFQKTFMPARYRLTDKSGKPRKINGKFRSLREWLNTKKIYL